MEGKIEMLAESIQLAHVLRVICEASERFE
jgi:hypothetical protein